MKAAFEEVKGSFDNLAVQAANIQLTNIQSHGLGGAQLDFKLRTVEFWADRVRHPNIGSRWIRRLLDAIDTLLDSILDAVGIGSSIKEIKDAIRDAMG